MFDAETVFVTGAGASWHYGYPTGAELITAVRQFVDDLRQFCRSCFDQRLAVFPEYFSRFDGSGMRKWESAEEECADFLRRIDDAAPLVIDYFLGQNPQLADLGRLAIGWVIIRQRALKKKNGDWIRYILHELANGCSRSEDLLANKVNFVTFNYDCSLEERLEAGLHARSLFAARDISEFMNGRFIHVYGSVDPAEIDTLALERAIQGGSINQASAAVSVINNVAEASTNLQIIDPSKKQIDRALITSCREDIFNARRLYIFGFSFDEANVSLIGLDKLGEEMIRTSSGMTPHQVFLTNFNDYRNINQKVSRAIPENSGRVNISKSIRNVDDALYMDFDLSQ